MTYNPESYRRWYQRNRARILARHQKRYARDAAYQQAVKDRAAAWKQGNADRRRETSRAHAAAWLPANRHKRRAHYAVQAAIDAGRMKRAAACELCASTRFVIAHHDDYSRPLDVRWVCRCCHHRIHHPKKAA